MYINTLSLPDALHKPINMITWIQSFIHLLFPHQCTVCNRPLSHAEKCLCTVCSINMPRTNYHLQKDNLIEKQFWGQIPIERATALFYYQKGSNYCNIIHDLKYKGRKQIGRIMGHYIAGEIQESGFFDNIDIIVPVPLHPKRFKKRGYNQSEWIAKGIADITHIPVNNYTITRKTYTDSQTSQTVFERRENAKDTFNIHRPEQFAGKHILLVDDVLTTGATVMACASVFSHIEGIRFSVLALGVSR